LIDAGNGGRGSGATMSSAKIVPRASCKGTLTGDNRFAIERMMLVACGTVTNDGALSAAAALIGMAAGPKVDN